MCGGACAGVCIVYVCAWACAYVCVCTRLRMCVFLYVWRVDGLLCVYVCVCPHVWFANAGMGGRGMGEGDGGGIRYNPGVLNPPTETR